MSHFWVVPIINTELFVAVKEYTLQKVTTAKGLRQKGRKRARKTFRTGNKSKFWPK